MARQGWPGRGLARPGRARLGKARCLVDLADYVESSELHGGGAHDDDCPICAIMQRARILTKTARPSYREIDLG